MQRAPKAEFTIRIPKLVAGKIVSDRSLVNVYHTNSTTKPVALYLLLKALSPSGKIQRWDQQSGEVAELLGITGRTLRSWLLMAERLGYLELNNNSIKLFSYDHFCELHEVAPSGFIVLCVPRASVRHLPVMLYGAEISENQQRRRVAAQRRFLLNPSLARIRAELKCADAELIEQLKRRQLSALKYGSTGEAPAMWLNADVNRNIGGLRKAWGMRDRRTVVYWKSKLDATGVAQVSSQVIESPEGAGNWTRDFPTAWDKQRRVRRVFLPDAITLNPAIFL